MVLSHISVAVLVCIMEPIKVLMFGWELPPYNSGGLGVACYGLTKGLSSLGIPISFALPRQLPYHIPFMKVLSYNLKGVKVTALNSTLKAYLTSAEYSQSGSSNYHLAMQMYGQSLYDEAIRFGQIASSWASSVPHTIIHAHDWMTYPAGMAAAQRSHKPLVAHVHATEYDRTGGHVDSRIADLEYQGFNAADHVIAVSNYTKSIVNNYYGISPDKVTVVHNGIDLTDFSPQDIRRVFPSDHIVLFVGRLTFQKGVDYFLHSAKIVLDQHPNTVFIIAGAGDMYQQHILEAAMMGISKQVIFTGFMSGEKLKALYRMADVFVMPSVSEPYGLVALEALACGVPCIVSKQSGVAEVIKNVYTVDFWDTHKIARYINQVLAYPQINQDRVEHSRADLEALSWDSAAVKTLSVYQSLSS